MISSFVKAAAATAALLAAPAFAACPAANQYNFLFSGQAAATLAYGSSYTYTATTAGGATQTFTVGFTQNGLTSTTVGGEVRPNISTSHHGGTAANALVVGGILPSRTVDITSATNVMVTTLTFPVAVRDVTFTMFDVDFGANQFRDWIMIRGFGVGTYTGSHVTPFGTNNGSGPYANASSSLNLGPVTTPYTITAQQGVGVSVADNTTNVGSVTASFVQPVTSVEIRYGNYPLTSGETATGQQAFGISGVSFCPMPVISMAKTAAPVEITGDNRFNIPGADVDYSITITNSGGSPVDLNATSISDPLSADVTFFNGDIDTVNAGTQNFVFTPGTSGLTLSGGDIAYFNAVNAPITPAAGYDPLVRSVRWIPQGTMAANSTATIRFRTRIN